MPETKIRFAIFKNAERQGITDATFDAFLPDNYNGFVDVQTDTAFVVGRDVAGWTLDEYVLPRLASGLYFGTEVTS